MKNLTLVRFEGQNENSWYRISNNDIVNSFVNESLKIVSKDTVEKYNIKEGDRKDKFERIYELIIDGDGYDSTVEEYIEGCEDIEDAKIEAEEKIKDGYIWFASVNSWEKFNIEDIKLVEKYINNNEDIVEEFEDALNDCKYAETFIGDYVRVDSIDEDLIYFDKYMDEFVNGFCVLSWDTEEYYWYHDGSNWQMNKIIEIKEVKAIHLGNEQYNTGTIETYELANKKIFKIDSSMYQGSIDGVLEDYEDVIEDYEETKE